MTPTPYTTQDVVVRALTDTLNVKVSTELPKNRPDEHIVISRIGGGQSTFGANDPRFLIECYARTEVAAEALAERAQHAWQSMRQKPIVRGWSDGNLAKYPAPDTDHSRFQFTGTLRLRL